jgi:hypothetical protein
MSKDKPTARDLQPGHYYYTRIDGGSYEVLSIAPKGRYHVRITARSLSNNFTMIADYLADAEVMILPKRYEGVGR